MKTNQKFMLHLFDNVTKEQVFLFFWLGVGAMFVGAILWQWQRSERRNFRPMDPTAPPKGPKRNLNVKQAPRLGSGTKDAQNPVEKIEGPTKRLGK